MGLKKLVKKAAKYIVGGPMLIGTDLVTGGTVGDLIDDFIGDDGGGGGGFKSAEQIASEQYKMSLADRKYFDSIYSGNNNYAKSDFATKAVQDAINRANLSKGATANELMDYKTFVKTYAPEGFTRFNDVSNSIYDSYLSTKFNDGKGVDGNQRNLVNKNIDLLESYQTYRSATPVITNLLTDAEKLDIENMTLSNLGITKSVDQMLYDAVKVSDSKMALALGDFADYAAGQNAARGLSATGMSPATAKEYESLSNNYAFKMGKLAEEASKNIRPDVSYQSQSSYQGFNRKIVNKALDKYGEYTEKALANYNRDAGKYQSQLELAAQKYTSEYGTPYQDILAAETGRMMAGISSSYKQAQDQMLGVMKRKGLTGGVEAGALSQLAQAQGMTSASALSQARQQAIALSDARRDKQYATALDTAGLGMGIVGQTLAARQEIGANAMNAEVGSAQYSTSSSSSRSVGYTASDTAAYNAQAAGLNAVRANLTDQDQRNINNLFNLQNTYQSGILGTYSAGSGALSTMAGIEEARENRAAAESAADSAARGQILGSAMTAGATLALASDKRLKKNIVPTGDKIGEFNEYTWDWIDGHDYGYNKGVLAQEVIERKPEAVTIMDNGYYGVRYDML